MKISNLFLASCLASSLVSIAQNPNANANAQWRINGNSASTTDFIGTTNNQPLIFKTNNLERLQVDAQGKLLFNSGQEMIINQSGLIRQVKANPISAYMIKVGGSGHFDGEVNTKQLFVQEYITYMKSLKGPSINVDSIRMDSTRGIYGHTKIFGNVQIKQNLQVDGNTNVNGSLMANSILVGNATNNIDLKVQTNGSGGTTLGFGYRTGPISAGPISCVVPYTGPITASFNGRSVITTAVTTDPVFDFRNNTTNGTIDYGFDYVANPSPPQRTGPSTIPSIKINGSCWGDVELAKGGGFVSTGNHFEVGSPTSNSDITANIFSRSKIGQRVTLNTGMTDAFIQSNPSFTNYNTQLFVNKNLTRALSVFNTVTNANGDETFVIYGDGKTYIGTGRPKVGGVAENAMLSVDGLILAKEIRVAVSTTTHWADYVFDKNYKLMSLKELENFIKQNNHLPEVPSAENVVKEGINVNEISATLLKKIEELTLYTIELQKQLEKQQQEINSLKK